MGVLLSFLPLLILGGLVFAAINGLRSAADDPADPMDATETAKSFALHLGLFVAFIAGAIGAIDVLQSLVEEGDRLAGSNSDLARGLSLLLVAGPAFALLLRPISRRCADRRSLVGRSTRGWSVYLFAALGVTLIATLTSVAQITDDLTSDIGAAEPTEIMQLFVWLALWLVHWFVLRPWLHVRGDAHLAFGTISGLVWMLSGLGAVTFRVLAAGYESAFETPLDDSLDVSFWLVITLVGAAVWAWHWLLAFNGLDPSGVVEGDRRGSPLWFFTIVTAGVLPGVIAILITVTAMVSGLMIWFIGTTSLDAAEYFEPAPALIAALFIGTVTWAYHRWQLDRLVRTKSKAERNEALRFHDYVVVTAGLVAVVGATAALVDLFIDAVIAPTPFAEFSSAGNSLIIILTILCAGGAVWWRYWSTVEGERSKAPIEESDSFWRKLYLIASFGVGGLVLAVSLTWVLFTLLRDLLDSEFGRQTIEDLANPIGWAIAVVGGVWYHFGVWQADRAVLADRPPPPPEPVRAATPVAATPTATPPPPPAQALPAPVAVAPSPAGLSSRLATPADAGELFTLQQADRGDRLATAASIVEPVESFAQMQDRLTRSVTTVVVDRGRVVGFATRPSGDADATPTQVVVAPDRSSTDIVALLRS